MRPFHPFLVPILAATLACGPSRLTRAEAERDIRQDYPVQVTIQVPDSASAIKGSPEHARLVSLQEALVRGGWFKVARTPAGDRETFAFSPAPGAPASIRTAPRGFVLPAAEAEFVRALALAPERDGARVTYQIRLARPTAFFPLFQTLHPGVRIGDTKDRHAAYRRQGRDWVLQGTDEVFRK
jgi:hypothetical protein